MTPVLNEYKTKSVWGSLSVGCADLLLLGQPHSQKGPLSSSSDFPGFLLVPPGRLPREVGLVLSSDPFLSWWRPPITQLLHSGAEHLQEANRKELSSHRAVNLGTQSGVISTAWFGVEAFLGLFQVFPISLSISGCSKFRLLKNLSFLSLLRAERSLTISSL